MTVPGPPRVSRFHAHETPTRIRTINEVDGVTDPDRYVEGRDTGVLILDAKVSRGIPESTGSSADSSMLRNRNEVITASSS